MVASVTLRGAGRKRRDADPELGFLQDILECPRAILDHGDTLLDERLPGLEVLNVEWAGHGVVTPDPVPHPTQRLHRLPFSHQAAGWILRVHEVPAPAVSVHLKPFPAYVDHAPPQILLTRASLLLHEAEHRPGVVIVGPTAVRIRHAVPVEQIFVIKERQRAVILWQRELSTAPGEQRRDIGPDPSR